MPPIQPAETPLPRRGPDPALGAAWERIGKRNPWIRTADDPPFTATSARMCESRYELRKWLEYGSWANGTAFAVEQDPVSSTWTPVLCFVQQGECSDEWLVIKSFPDQQGGWEHVAFESFSLLRGRARSLRCPPAPGADRGHRDRRRRRRDLGAAGHRRAAGTE